MGHISLIFEGKRKMQKFGLKRFVFCVVMGVVCFGGVNENVRVEGKGKGSRDVVQVKMKAVGYMMHKKLAEVSGIVRERCKDGKWWVMNDGGNDGVVYRINGKGDVVAGNFEEEVGGYWLGVKNIDWEDVAIQGDRLYVSDLGNNKNQRKDLGVYVVEGLWEMKEGVGEKRMEWKGEVEKVKWIGVRYPDQKQWPAKEFKFDCEAIFFLDGKLHVLTKHRVGQLERMPRSGTKLYRLNEMKEGEVNELELLDENEAVGFWVTGADVSPSGDYLAVLGMWDVWVFERPRDKKSCKWLTEGKCWHVKLSQEQAKQAEGICWDDEETLRIANEQRELYLLTMKQIKQACEEK